MNKKTIGVACLLVGVCGIALAIEKIVELKKSIGERFDRVDKDIDLIAGCVEYNCYMENRIREDVIEIKEKLNNETEA